MVSRRNAFDAFVATVVAAYAVSLSAPESGWASLLHEYVPVVLPLTAAAACIAAARRSAPRARATWLGFAVGAAAWGAGDLGFTILDAVGVDPAGSFTIADVGYLLLIPAWSAALFLHPLQARGSFALAGTVMDAMTVVVAAAFLTIQFVLLPIVHQASDALGLAVTLAYPVGDLALITAVALLIARTPRGVRPGEAILAGVVALFAIGDILFARLNILDAYETGHPVDLAWVLAFAGITWTTRLGLAEDSPTPRHTARDPLLSALGFGGIAALAVGAWVAPAFGLLLVGAAVTALLVVVRQALLLFENHRLIRALEESVHDLEEAAIAAQTHEGGGLRPGER